MVLHHRFFQMDLQCPDNSHGPANDAQYCRYRLNHAVLSSAFVFDHQIRQKNRSLAPHSIHVHVSLLAHDHGALYDLSSRTICEKPV